MSRPLQLLLTQCAWKEHKSDSGRAYFYNTATKESRWTVPKELDELKEQIKKEEENGWVWFGWVWFSY